MTIQTQKIKGGKSKSELKTRTIRARMATAICIITLLTGVCLTVLNTFMHRRTAWQGMETSVVTAANAYSKSIENKITVYKAKLEGMATDVRLTPNATKEELDVLRAELIREYGFLDVSFANSNGKPYDAPDIDISEREYFKAAISGETYLSSPGPEDR